MMSIKITYKGRKENFKFLENYIQKDKSCLRLSSAIHLEGWGKHFEHEYIVKPSKNLRIEM